MSDSPDQDGPPPMTIATRTTLSAAARDLETRFLELDEYLHSFSVAASRHPREDQSPAEVMTRLTHLAALCREVGAESSALASVVRAAIDGATSPAPPPGSRAADGAPSQTASGHMTSARLLSDAARVVQDTYDLHEHLTIDPNATTDTKAIADALITSVRAHATNLLVLAGPEQPSVPAAAARPASRDDGGSTHR